jgi:hypothetical protein
MSVGAEPEEIELEELSPEPYAASPARGSAVRSGEPELSLEAIDEEVVEEDELGAAPSFGALDEEPAGRDLALDRGTLSTAPVSVELSATSGPTDIAIPVEVNLRGGAARVQLHIRLTLNLNLRR